MGVAPAPDGGSEMVIVRAAPLEFVVQVVNEWGTMPRLAASEQDADYPDFMVIAARFLPAGSPLAGPASDPDLVRIADALFPVFAAETEAAAAAAVNDALALGAQRPRLGLDGGRLSEQWQTVAAERLLASCMLTMYRQLIQWGDSRRLGLCEATRCVDVYVDLSPTGQRRFCSVNCRDRSRVAAFRARHKRLRQSATLVFPPPAVPVPPA
jgi:hypothetical protein